MTFITVDEITRRFPESTAVVISAGDAKRPQEERDQYKFSLSSGIEEEQKIKRLVSCYALGGERMLRKGIERFAPDFATYLRDAALWLDISGYAIGSNWGPKKAISIMLLRVAAAKSFEVPFYFLPQSFGPLDFRGWKGALAQHYLKKYLPYASAIFAREQEGFEQLVKRYGLCNVIRSNDLVLQNSFVDLRNIFIEPKAPVQIVPQGNNVAIIPNQKNMKYGQKEDIYKLYEEMIRLLLENGKNAYLIYHSTEDLSICIELKRRYFEEDERVILIEQELNCFDFDKVVAQMDFVIASRFHAIVHAYRRSVPSVTLGWATKYRELLALFGQERFQFDVREQLDHKIVLAAEREMLEHYHEEAAKIASILAQVQRENVFDAIFEKETSRCQ